MNNICQKCQKARATVHLTEIDTENNKPQQMHLCDACARESSTPPKPPKGKTLTFSTMLSGLQEKAQAGRSAGAKLVCPDCGMTYQEFRGKGRFGCLSCYDAFGENLCLLLEKVHGASQYVGPLPSGKSPGARTSAALEQELVDLRRRLSRVVKDEDYEEAARLRDRIAAVEQSLQESRHE